MTGIDKIAISTYGEYKKRCPEAPEWDELSIGQQEGFTAASFHMAATLVVLNGNTTVSHQYILTVDGPIIKRG